MTLLCVGALVAGLIAASALPVLPYARAVPVAIVIGSTVMILEGSPIGQTRLSALMLLFASQIDYGFGLFAAPIVARSVAAAPPDGTEKREQSPARPFQTGNKPR